MAKELVTSPRPAHHLVWCNQYLEQYTVVREFVILASSSAIRCSITTTTTTTTTTTIETKKMMMTTTIMSVPTMIKSNMMMMMMISTVILISPAVTVAFPITPTSFFGHQFIQYQYQYRSGWVDKIDDDDNNVFCGRIIYGDSQQQQQQQQQKRGRRRTRRYGCQGRDGDSIRRLTSTQSFLGLTFPASDIQQQQHQHQQRRRRRGTRRSISRRRDKSTILHQTSNTISTEQSDKQDINTNDDNAKHSTKKKKKNNNCLNFSGDAKTTLNVPNLSIEQMERYLQSQDSNFAVLGTSTATPINLPVNSNKLSNDIRNNNPKENKEEILWECKQPSVRFLAGLEIQPIFFQRLKRQLIISDDDDGDEDDDSNDKKTSNIPSSITTVSIVEAKVELLDSKNSNKQKDSDIGQEGGSDSSTFIQDDVEGENIETVTADDDSNINHDDDDDDDDDDEVIIVDGQSTNQAIGTSTTTTTTTKVVKQRRKRDILKSFVWKCIQWLKRKIIIFGRDENLQTKMNNKGDEGDDDDDETEGGVVSLSSTSTSATISDDSNPVIPTSKGNVNSDKIALASTTTAEKTNTANSSTVPSESSTSSQPPTKTEKPKESRMESILRGAKFTGQSTIRAYPLPNNASTDDNNSSIGCQLSVELTLSLEIPLPSIMFIPPGLNTMGGLIVRRIGTSRTKDFIESLAEQAYENLSSKNDFAVNE